MAATEAEIRDGGEEGGLSRPWSIAFLVVGIGCGFATHFFIDRAESLPWQIGPPLGLLIGGLAFCLAVDPRRWIMAATGSTALGLLLGLLATTTVFRFGPHAEWNSSFSLVAEALIVAQIAVPFLQTWQEQGRPSFPYERLFAHAWNNSLTIALGAGFTGLFWLILWLFSLLFGYVGFDQLDRLIAQPAFAWSASAGAGALGIYAGRDYRHIVIALRRIVFTLFSVLTPLYLVLALAFAVALAAGGFEKLAAVTSATATLIALLVIGIVLFNTVLRDGTPEAEASRWLRRCAALLAPALLALCAFAAYGIYLRIAQYGMTPERIWVTAAVVALALHCLVYVAALVAPGGWMRLSRQANIGVAGMVALIAVLLQTPLADPYRLSAESQYRRLVSGAANAATFDYGFLKFRLGRAGVEALERIAADSGLAPREVVESKLATLRTMDNYWQWAAMTRQDDIADRQRALHDPRLVQRVPADLVLPEDLGTAIRRELAIKPQNCGDDSSKACLIAAADLTDSPGLEYLFASLSAHNNLSLDMLEKIDGEWRNVRLQFYRDGSATFQSLLEGRIATLPADHRDLRIGDEVIRLRY